MNKFERFCYKYEHLGLRKLMLFIVVCNALVFVMTQFPATNSLYAWLAFQPNLIMQGQIWRLITFVFIPPDSMGPIFTIIALYFYYWIGNTLEQEWGRLKFTIYYFAGMLATAIFCFATGSAASATFINMSLFLAFATIFPEHRILLFFIIPIKIKWVAIATAVLFFGASLLTFPFGWSNLLPLVAVLNYFLFFHQHFFKLFRKNQHQTKNVIHFKTAVRQTKQQEAHQGYSHKCTTCGVTNTQAPDTEFRYCSLCARYECYCSQHIFTHEHTKQ